MQNRWHRVRIIIAAAALVAPAVLAMAAAPEERLSEQREAAIRGHFLHMVVRADAATERLGKISQRIQSRISRMRVDDENRARVQAARDAADAKLREATAALENLKLRLGRTRTDPDPRAAFRQARRMVGEVKDRTGDVHASFTAAAALLQQALGAPGSR
mgnify:CR=1 FL=1